MAEKVRVAIRVFQGKAVIDSIKVSEEVTMKPGTAYFADADDYAVKTSLATGNLVLLGTEEEAPQPDAPVPEFLQNIAKTPEAPQVG